MTRNLFQNKVIKLFVNYKKNGFILLVEQEHYFFHKLVVI